MSDDLDRPLDCRELCLRVRFSLDEPMPLSDSYRQRRERNISEAVAGARSNALRVSPRLMPDLHAAVARAAERLLLERPPEVWVKCDPNPNASVIAVGERSVVILHSSLVNLLTMDEISSVIGHEFAHIVLDHAHDLPGDESQELLTFESRRAAEVSCDRIGLLAAPDVATALRSELKLLSGLGASHVRFEPEAIIEHLAHHPDDVDAEWESVLTHPTGSFRFWALMRFAESDLYRTLAGLDGGRPFAEVEREIEDRFLAAGGGLAFRETSKVVHAVLAWSGVLMVADDDAVTETEREMLVQLVGRVWADDAVAYVRRNGIKAAERRLAEALSPIGHVGSPTRARIESLLRDFAGRTNLDGKADEILERIRKAAKPG